DRQEQDGEPDGIHIADAARMASVTGYGFTIAFATRIAEDEPVSPPVPPNGSAELPGNFVRIAVTCSRGSRRCAAVVCLSLAILLPGCARQAGQPAISVAADRIDDPLEPLNRE